MKDKYFWTNLCGKMDVFHSYTPVAVIMEFVVRREGD